MKFDEGTKRMYLAGYYRCSSPEEVEANTGFAVDVSKAVMLPEPNEDILNVLRTKIDPEKIFLD